MAILLAATMLSLALLTASVGVVIEGSAAEADAGRVATDLESSLDAVAATGVRRGRVSFTSGHLRVAPRTVRVLNSSGVVQREDVGALVFTAGQTRTAYVAGMIVRGGPGGARRVVDPPVSASAAVVIVGVVRLGASPGDAVGGDRPTTVPLRTNVTHERRVLGTGEYRLAVETATPEPWERFFRDQGAAATRRDFDGDGLESVVGRYPGTRSGYVVVHDLALEVGW